MTEPAWNPHRLVRSPERPQRHVPFSIPTLRRLIGRVARRWLLEHGDAVQPWDRKHFAVPGGGDTLSPTFRNTFIGVNAQTRANGFGNYPAAEQIAIALYEGLQLPMDKALAVDR